MTIEQYDIKLSRLSSEDIELVRFHRNSQRIQQFMAYKKTISQRQQENWFKSIDNKLNYYFIIEYQGEKIGLINCKNVVENQMVGEGGGVYLETRGLENTCSCHGDISFYRFHFS